MTKHEHLWLLVCSEAVKYILEKLTSVLWLIPTQNFRRLQIWYLVSFAKKGAFCFDKNRILDEYQFDRLIGLKKYNWNFFGNLFVEIFNEDIGNVFKGCQLKGCTQNESVKLKFKICFRFF